MARKFWDTCEFEKTENRYPIKERQTSRIVAYVCNLEDQKQIVRDHNNIKWMWIRVKGTDVGMAIEVDPFETIDKSVEIAIIAAQKYLNAKGLSTCSVIPREEYIFGEINKLE